MDDCRMTLEVCPSLPLSECLSQRWFPFPYPNTLRSSALARIQSCARCTAAVVGRLMRLYARACFCVGRPGAEACDERTVARATLLRLRRSARPGGRAARAGAGPVPLPPCPRVPRVPFPVSHVPLSSHPLPLLPQSRPFPSVRTHPL